MSRKIENKPYKLTYTHTSCHPFEHGEQIINLKKKIEKYLQRYVFSSGFFICYTASAATVLLAVKRFSVIAQVVLKKKTIVPF